jgi:hypothetical protein
MHQCLTAYERKAKADAAPDDYIGKQLRKDAAEEAKKCADYAAKKQAANQQAKRFWLPRACLNFVRKCHALPHGAWNQKGRSLATSYALRILLGKPAPQLASCRPLTVTSYKTSLMFGDVAVSHPNSTSR